MSGRAEQIDALVEKLLLGSKTFGVKRAETLARHQEAFLARADVVAMRQQIRGVVRNTKLPTEVQLVTIFDIAVKMLTKLRLLKVNGTTGGAFQNFMERVKEVYSRPDPEVAFAAKVATVVQLVRARLRLHAPAMSPADRRNTCRRVATQVRLIRKRHSCDEIAVNIYTLVTWALGASAKKPVVDGSHVFLSQIRSVLLA